MKLGSFLAIKLVLASAILFVSCSRVETLFEIPARVDMTIPAGLNTFDVFGLDVCEPFLFEFALDTRGFDLAEIDRVVAIEGTFRSFFNSGDLNFLNRIEIDVIDPLDPDRTREVFFVDPIPLGPKNEIELNPSLPDIQDFIFDGDKLIFRVEVTSRSIATTNVDIRIDMTFGAVAPE